MHVHLISFDIPYPANYGGAIDVFYKLISLRNAGVDVTLHCFHKPGRRPQPLLGELCDHVYYYERRVGWQSNLSLLPYNVMSRRSSLLVSHLLEDSDPIIFEALSTTACMNDHRLDSRVKLFRECNIEHDYFNGLAQAEQSVRRRMFYRLEIQILRTSGEGRLAHYSIVAQ